MITTLYRRGEPPARPEPPNGQPRGRLIQDRRRFLATSLAAAGAYVVTSAGAAWIVGPGRAWAAEMQVLDADLAETLLHMTRALYPHDFLGDAHYAAVVADLDAEAAGFDDKERVELLRSGMLELNDAAGGTFTSATDEQREEALTKIAGSPFFEAVRGKTIVSLYNQPEVWTQFGYEGPSYEKGGYLFNGFDDLDWLPDPPAEASPPVQL
jgi:hypothetical protein